MQTDSLRSVTLLAGLAVAWSSPTTACAQDAPAGDQERPRPLVAAENLFPKQTKFDRPLWVDVTATDPGSLYVVVQPGQVFRVPRDPAADARDTFLDLGSVVYVNENWEEGLLGFQFDPAYAQNGHVWVCYTEKTDLVEGEMKPGKTAKSTRRSIVARYGTTVKGGMRVVDPASELRVLTVFQPFGNHNGGTIVFGPDGMLYLAFGDGGAQRDPFKNGQDKGVLLGKVLRIDVRNATAEKPYAVPPDNPFVGEAGARGEVWCYGLRNPWRIAFDRATGDLWCGDVGQDRLEEVDRLVKGGNYGWSIMEGTEHFAKKIDPPEGMIAPVAEYLHRDGVSVTGGFVYRGAKIPELVGRYVYGDFSTFRIWAVREDRAGGESEVREIGRAPSQLSSFAEDSDGELMITCFDGRVYRLAPAPKPGG